MTNSKAQIIATIGPASGDFDTLEAMVLHGLDVVRINFSWGDFEARAQQIKSVRELEKKFNRRIPIIVDLPGPRIQGQDHHTYDHNAPFSITEHDKEFIKFAINQNADYVAVSFVRDARDILKCREVLSGLAGKQKVIAKIERAAALEALDQIIFAADAVMIARGDLGNEVPIEQIPFIEEKIINKAKIAGKPVITATQMLLSMVHSPTPTRAEVTDVAEAILLGSDAVMLSEDTAVGKYPVEAVITMEKILVEAEHHKLEGRTVNHL